MQVRPNQTDLEGEIIALLPALSGRGMEVKIAVRKNVSANAEDDFLRCAPGDVVELTAPDAPDVRVGDAVRAQARLLAGPKGSRAILQSIRRI